MIVGLTEYLWKGSADIFLLLLKLCLSIVKFIKLSLLSYVLWSEFCLGGNFAHVIYYAIIETLVVPKRKIKRCNSQFSGDTLTTSSSMDDVLHIEAAAFCDL